MLWAGRVEELKGYVAQGLSRSQIAQIYDVTRNSIVGACWRHGVKTPFNAARAGALTVKFKERKLTEAGERRIKTRARKKMRQLLFEAPADEPEPLRISLLDLTETQCRWVCEGTDDHCLPTYCGHQCVAGSRWCGHHYGRVYL